MNTKPAFIASANTRNGFAIGIICTGNHFSVVRMNRRSQYVTLTNHTTEAAARTAANREWAADRGVAA